MSSKKNKPSKKVIVQDKTTSSGISFSRGFLWIGFGVSFLIQFIIYILFLAPTVTFEDSGELITAVYTFGVPHQPGYPLFTMLGKLFTIIPAGSVAYRVNLMSAFFSALAIGLLFPVIGMWIREISTRVFFAMMDKKKEWLLGISVGAVLLYTGTAPSYFSQAVIAEVYGLNNFYTVLLVLLFLLWRQTYPVINNSQTDEKDKLSNRYFYGYLFVCGLALSNHHTSAFFLPLGVFFILITDKRFFLNWSRLLKGAGCFILGLLPYGYLPLASSANPPMDWGNPENWTNFWRVVTRHQYGLDLDKPRSLSQIASQIGLHYDLFFEQFGWVFLTAGLLTLILMFIYRRPLFFYALLFALLTGPLVAYVTNVNLNIQDPFAISEQRALVSVMYLPFYLFWGALSGVGLFFIVQWIQRKTRNDYLVMILTGVFAAYAVWAAVRHIRKETMHDYYYVEEFYSQLEKHLQPNAMIIVNWDPFAFPPMYYQFVEKRMTDMVFIDVELLRRTWYIEMLRHHYPELMHSIQQEADEFIEAVKPFENKEPFDPNYIQTKYIGMINTLIDRQYTQRPVYLMIYDPIRPLESGIAPAYRRESCLIARRLVKEGDKFPGIKESAIDLSYLTRFVSRDRMSDMLRNYHAMLLAEKSLQQIAEVQQALRYMDQAAALAVHPAISRQIRLLREQIQSLSNPNP